MKGEAWLPLADRALSVAAGEVKLIRAATPANADEELTRLEGSFARGVPVLPRWRYEESAPRAELLVALQRLADFLDTDSPLGRVYASRARELALEASVIHAVGSPALARLARQRFVGTAPDDVADLAKASELAKEWSSAEHADRTDRRKLVQSCNRNDPGSLVSVMAREAGKLRLAMRVIVQPGLASLAAVSEGAILVAPRRWIRRRDVQRTVLHEIEGHALPRARASAMPCGIFGLGTARGVDDQEGRALLLEEGAGFLDAARKRELGLRHFAAEAVLDGADLVQVVEQLRQRGAGVREAVRIAARAGRGGSGVGGLGREIVYLPAFVRVGRARQSDQGELVSAVMAHGRISAEAAPTIGAFCPQATVTCATGESPEVRLWSVPA